jgi:hypothetical protein
VTRWVVNGKWFSRLSLRKNYYEKAKKLFLEIESNESISL